MEFSTRGFLYGDGLFETMRMHKGQIIHLTQHFARLLHGMQLLKMEIPKGFSPQWLEDFISTSICKEIPTANAPNWRVRCTVYRAEGGLYTPSNNQAKWQISCTPLDYSEYQLNKKGLVVGKYTDIRLSTDILSALKTISALPYVMAGLYRNTEHPEWDDCLLVNHYDRIVEATAANIFVRIGERFYTPALTEGCVAGVMRQIIIDWFEQNKIAITEISLSDEMLQKADEIWLTNAIQGIRWVGELAFVLNKKYKADWANRCVAGLNGLYL